MTTAEQAAITRAIAKVLTKDNIKKIDNIAQTAAQSAVGGVLTTGAIVTANTIGEAAAREYITAHPTTTGVDTGLIAWITNAIKNFTTPATTTPPATTPPATTPPATTPPATTPPATTPGTDTTDPIDTASSGGLLATLEKADWKKILKWAGIAFGALILFRIFFPNRQ